VRLTQGDGWHNTAFARNGAVFVDTYSNPDTPPQVSIRRPDGSMIEWLEHNELNAKHPYGKYLDAHLKTEYGTLKAKDGQTLYYSMIKPANFNPAKKYPVFLFTYGGPHSQHVQRRGVTTSTSTWRSKASSSGAWITVVRAAASAPSPTPTTINWAGGSGRLTGVEWLGQQSYVDAKRIGVFGWSYGGFMTLRLLAEASDKIAMGVSVAPVTDWSLYDTHYTEQFMGTPKENQKAMSRQACTPT
jgi:dipeptidyl-peptidase-4